MQAAAICVRASLILAAVEQRLARTEASGMNSGTYGVSAAFR